MFRRLPTLLLARLAVQIPVALTDVTWDSPATGDIYVPGDTLQAVWTSPDKVVSPSFTICTGTADNGTSVSDGADCGTAVWPSVEQNGTEFSISLAIPNITGNGQYYLVMKDDAGTVYDTPNFSLALTKDGNSTANSTAASNSSTSQPTSTTITYLPSHPAPTAVAIAVPLALVAATLLGALLLLLFRARRSRQRDKDRLTALRDAEKLGSRDSTMSFASATDIERAVWALTATRGYGAPAQYSQAPSHANSTRRDSGVPGIGAAAAAALGIGAFGWAHDIGPAAPTAPAASDAYTPAPVTKYATGSAARTYAAAAPLAPLTPAPASRADRIYPASDTVPRPVSWRETDWRGTQRMFADDPAQSSGPPQLPQIQIHASSPPLDVQQSIPPPPPTQLFPGSPHSPIPRAYTPPYGPSPSLPVFASDSRPLQTPGTDANASLNVISNYFQPSPALPQGQYLTPPDPHALELPELRAPPTSLTRARSLRRLETVLEPLENNKPLSVRPADRVGTDLYGAVSRAVGA